MGVKISGMKRNIVLLSFIFSLFAHITPAQDALKQIRSNVIQTINGKDYYIHSVKKGQTLYMICKAYGADINEVIKENPEVKEGIYADEKIRIPVDKPAEQPKKTQRQIVPENKEVKPEVPAEVEAPCSQTGSGKNKTYNVALMLPLMLGEVPSMNVENTSAKHETEYKSLRYIQFYEGFRMALDSLEKTGISLKVYVYDVDKDTTHTKRLMRNPEMKNMDLIIGLLYHKEFQIVADFAQKNGINIVNPLSERELIIADHSRVFKVMPSNASQATYLAGILASEFKDQNILIARNSQYGDRDAADRLKAECDQRNIQPTVTEGYGPAIEKLSKDKPNVIVTFSENKVYAIELLTKLNEIRNDYNLTIIGLPRWDKLEGLESDYLVNLKVHMMTPSFIDYQDKDIKIFVQRFQDHYKTDPELLAFQGFDVAYYFLSALQKYGKNFNRCISEMSMKSLETRFQFSHSGDNGYENNHWEMYEYENYRLTRDGK
jgi:ABC-type branched-subunit amino acid transport system substrate-binding protein/LysM repeat protein